MSSSPFPDRPPPSYKYWACLAVCWLCLFAGWVVAQAWHMFGWRGIGMLALSAIAAVLTGGSIFVVVFGLARLVEETPHERT